jgi:hypothetical protein
MFPRAITFLAILLAAPSIASAAEPLPWIRVSDDRQGFVRDPGGQSFTPWGFNYDHDEAGRLLEDYWIDEWQKVEQDFAEMRELGANVVRIHLQFGRFMDAADRPNAEQLAQLGRLLELAERTGLYLDLTGLGCYHKQDVPGWYDALDEPARWDAQCRLWEAVAGRCADCPAVFCYDLMNEPVVPGGKRAAGDWLGPAFAGKHFVQCITLDQAERARPQIARAWIERLCAAIRRQDARHLITVGLVDWSLDRPGLTSGFVPSEIVEPLDFLCVHIYPEKGKVPEALDTLAAFDVGKPVVIEETFPLKAGLDDFARFIDGSREHADGWIGFYWGQTREECAANGTIAGAITSQWLDFFAERARTLSAD